MCMQRRNFIRTGLLLSASYAIKAYSNNLDFLNSSDAYLMTVNGPVIADTAGFTLTHEHALVDFIGADKISPGRYIPDEAFEKILPYLKEVADAGCQTFVECTPNYLGRDVHLLQRLSKATSLNIITNTGYYGAAGEKFLPPHAYTETATQLAARWIKEWEDGIDGTGIKPGFIKTGVDKYPLSAVQQKIVEAAALTHLSTGLSIGIHTGDGDAAMEELKIIKSKDVLPDAWIWIHAQNESRRDYHFKAAKEGSWVSFDGVSPGSIKKHVNFLRDMKAEKLLHKALISHDAGWYHVGEINGGDFRNYNCIFTELIPAMKNEGFTQNEIEQVFIKNPARAFVVGIKKTKKPSTN